MNKPHGNRADWSNYWQGRAAGQSGEVFAGVGIETSEELASLWKAVFASIAGQSVLDLACGAGSALKHAAGLGAARLLAIDISEHAILSARKAVPEAVGLLGSADAIPIQSGCLDLVVSQFGFEYADRPSAAAEIGRILQPGGRFVAVVHMANGAIARECQAYLDQLDIIDRSQFIPATSALFQALYQLDRAPSQANQTAIEQSQKVFQDAQASVMPAVGKGGIAAHLHGGARQLYERRRNYAESDILGWLDGMASEIAAYRGRMAGMLGAAITAEEAAMIAGMIAGGGAHSVEPVLLGQEVAAHRIDALRAG